MRSALVCFALLALAACGSSETGAGDAAGVVGCDPAAPASRAASCVASFTPGTGAGYGQDRFPQIVLGEPLGGGLTQGSLDVLSLGMGGEIVLGFGGGAIADGEGADLIVFENAFYVNGDPEKPYVDLGEISVSDDGETFTPFPCHTGSYPYEGCAGWHAVLASPETGVSAFDPAVAGGEAFDLADVGMSRARFVRVRDVGASSAPPNAGFDLDAATIVHLAEP